MHLGLKSTGNLHLDFARSLSFSFSLSPFPSPWLSLALLRELPSFYFMEVFSMGQETTDGFSFPCVVSIYQRGVLSLFLVVNIAQGRVQNGLAGKVPTPGLIKGLINSSAL